LKSATPSGIDRDRAFSLLMTNVLVLPGLGSVLAGRRVGYVQSFLAVAGMLLSVTFAGRFGQEWWVSKQFPIMEPRFLGVGVLGVGLFGAGWVWALLTGYCILRQVQATSGGSGADRRGAKPPRLG